MSEISALKDLISSPGWDVLKEKLLLRRDQALRDLTKARDFELVKTLQMKIAEIDFILKFPHDVLQEVKLKESQDAS